MSPELLKETIVASVAAVCAAIPSALLVWWTWKRDQERLVVQKSPVTMQGLDGNPVLMKDNSGTPNLRVLIRNRSLFPVRVSAVGFDIDGTVLQMERPNVSLSMKQNPNPRSNQLYIPDDSVDPWEIQSGAYLIVESRGSWDSFREALEKAANKRKTSVEKLIMSRRVRALAALESGTEFASASGIRRYAPLVLKISAGVLLAFACFGFGYLWGNSHEQAARATQPSSKPLEARPLFTPQAASLEQQKICNEQAARFFHEYVGANTATSSHTSHYDPSVNVCYVRVYFVSGKPALITDTVYDAFAGRVYADFAWTGKLGNEPTVCRIRIPNKPVELCNTPKEFDDLVGKYFDVGD